MTTTRSDIDRLVLAAAQDVLGETGLSLDDNFFALGGTSIAAIDLMMLLSEQLATDVTLDVIFEHPTFGLMAEEIACAAPAVAGTTEGCQP